MIYKTTRLVTLSASIALLTACASSPIPVSENFPLTVQPKVRSAGHWNLLSKDVVKQTLETLSSVGTAAPLYVALPPQASTFDVAFREFLITELVKAQRVVSQVPDNAIEVSYKTQLVRINSGGPTSTQLILTTTVATGGRYLARQTDLYSVEEADASLFASVLPAQTMMKVVGQ